MGLLAQKQSRTKINKDPNNTKWTRDTKTFGQRILRSQGWQPGQYLGAQDAARTELHTAANASYIRVAHKDDMKGLGFDKAKLDEVTGLDVFSDLLSRLNGKSEGAVDGDRQVRLVLKTNRYVEAKWGPMRFVRGGLLNGTEMDRSKSDSSSDKVPKTKKRKTSGEAGSDAEVLGQEEKKRRKAERRAARLAVEVEPVQDKDAGLLREKKKKKSKTEKTNMDREKGSSVDAYAKESKHRKGRKTKETGADKNLKTEDRGTRIKKKRKLDESEPEKKAKKLVQADEDGRKRRKYEGEAKEAQSGSATPNPISAPAPTSTTGSSTPTGTGSSTPIGSRNFVRSRYIAQKRQAVLDTKALAQIFMVKS